MAPAPFGAGDLMADGRCDGLFVCFVLIRFVDKLASGPLSIVASAMSRHNIFRSLGGFVI